MVDIPIIMIGTIVHHAILFTLSNANEDDTLLQSKVGGIQNMDNDDGMDLNNSIVQEEANAHLSMCKFTWVDNVASKDDLYRKVLDKCADEEVKVATPSTCKAVLDEIFQKDVSPANLCNEVSEARE